MYQNIACVCPTQSSPCNLQFPSQNRRESRSQSKLIQPYRLLGVKRALNGANPLVRAYHLTQPGDIYAPHNAHVGVSVCMCVREGHSRSRYRKSILSLSSLLSSTTVRTSPISSFGGRSLALSIVRQPRKWRVFAGNGIRGIFRPAASPLIFFSPLDVSIDSIKRTPRPRPSYPPPVFPFPSSREISDQLRSVDGEKKKLINIVEHIWRIEKYSQLLKTFHFYKLFINIEKYV